MVDSQSLNEHPLAQYLDFTFSSFGKPEIDVEQGRIVLPVREFKVYAGFPDYEKSAIVLDGDLIFEGVVSSIREILEDENPEQKSYKIDDGKFPAPNGQSYKFYIGNFTYDPPGWIEWHIEAVTVTVRERSSKLADLQ